MLHRQDQALPQEGRAQASLERENAAGLSAAPGLQHQGVRAVELMHQSRPSRERRARQQGLVRLVRQKGARSDKAGKVPRVKLPGNQRVERRLHPSAVRDNRSVERKRERGLQRRGHNYLVYFRGGSRAKSSGAASLDKQLFL